MSFFSHCDVKNLTERCHNDIIRLVDATVWSDVVVDDMSYWTGPSPHSLMPSRQKSIPMCRLPLVTWALPGKVEGRRPKFDVLGK